MSLGTQRDGTAAIPPAERSTRPGWRDPRLWVGLLIVAASVVGGARLLAAADDTVPVWTVRADAAPGTTLSAGDLQARRVRFADEDDLGGYYRADEQLPSELRLVRAVGAGELLPRAAVGRSGRPDDAVELPVAVDAEQLPPSVHAGSVVDVYLLGRAGRPAGDDGVAPAAAGAPLIRAASVVDAPAIEAGFGASTGRRQLVLAVPQEAASAYFAAVAAVDAPVISVVRRD